MVSDSESQSGIVTTALRQLSLVSLVDGALAIVIILTSLFTFMSNDLFAYLSANLAFIPGGIFPVLGCALAGSILLGLAIGTIAGNVICLGWALYLPSVLYFSRLDIISFIIPGGFGLFSSSLPAPAIIVAGVILTGCTLAHGSIAEMKVLRSNYLARGAASDEVEVAMAKNLIPVTIVLLAALILAAAVSVIVEILIPVAVQYHVDSSVHLLYLGGGIVIFSLLIAVSLWLKRAG